MRVGGQAGRYDYYPSFDSFLYGMIKFIFYVILGAKKEKNSKANKQTNKKEGEGGGGIRERAKYIPYVPTYSTLYIGFGNEMVLF